ncbi:hypothetical protein LWM68_31960 [Niabella sp. W65]|nr:hypothetical protein [Niabella sp. W65]MCH7366975.1 hypothetical protein [Niabella sp. W65]ULT42663.1 hypothetical protein KRR40_03490 [Niabella sp. I65]
MQDLWRWGKPLIQKTNDRIRTAEAPAPGLICLKGGDLAKEIQESGTRPHVTAIKDIFEEPFFEEKYILYVPK